MKKQLYIADCPNCMVELSMNDEQMKQADGAVRCGTCNTVFHAPDYLRKASPPVLKTAPEQDDKPDTEIEDALDQEPLIVAEMTKDIETMTVSDAVMRLDLSGECAFLFRNSGSNSINMVYRRSDGNVGWVDPQGH